MGLLNKLKNVLFEEEEIEDTIVEEEPMDNTMEIPKSTMELPKINREPKKEKPVVKYDVEEEPDRELFQAERTFDFPAFDEDEFDDFSTIKKEEPKEDNYDTYERRVSNPTPKKKEYTPTKVVKPVEEEPKKLFRPSPVISPVYGILDKNYKKEDVLTREEVNDKKNVKLDVDSVRKKAFGTLEEDLAATINEPVEKFYEEPVKETIEIEEEIIEETVEKIEPEAQAMEDFIEEAIEEIIDDNNKVEEESLDNLLDKTVDIEIDVTKEMEIPSRLEKNEYEEEIDDEIPEELEDEPISEVPEVEEPEVSDDTLENDLFDLIDSMYENGDEEE